MTTLGKYRHLSRMTTASGKFATLAIDHRENLRESLQKAQAGTPVSDAQLSDFKLQVVRHLAPHVSALLIDPAYGIGPGISSSIFGPHMGLLAPLEVTNYTIHPSQREQRFIENWSVAKFKRAGGDGIKLLLYYHPDAPTATEKRDVVARIIDDCALYDIPFILEPIAFPRDPEARLSNDELRYIVVEGARTFSAMGVDILKVQFPVDVKTEPDEAVWQAALAELNEACAVPWVLLSAGVKYDMFRRQTELACQAGASGVMVGRAVWSEAVDLQGEERETFLATTGRERMAELAAIVEAQAVDWRTRVARPDGSFDWFDRYAAL